jgi:hypothetical protein
MEKPVVNEEGKKEGAWKKFWKTPLREKLMKARDALTDAAIGTLWVTTAVPRRIYQIYHWNELPKGISAPLAFVSAVPFCASGALVGGAVGGVVSVLENIKGTIQLVKESVKEKSFNKLVCYGYAAPVGLPLLIPISIGVGMGTGINVMRAFVTGEDFWLAKALIKNCKEFIHETTIKNAVEEVMKENDRKMKEEK